MLLQTLSKVTEDGVSKKETEVEKNERGVISKDPKLYAFQECASLLASPM
jgi:hypothetical protein